MIGDDITITVLEIKEKQIRLGIKAPREVPVHREEIYERIKQQKASSSVDPKDQK